MKTLLLSQGSSICFYASVKEFWVWRVMELPCSRCLQCRHPPHLLTEWGLIPARSNTRHSQGNSFTTWHRNQRSFFYNNLVHNLWAKTLARKGRRASEMHTLITVKTQVLQSQSLDWDSKLCHWLAVWWSSSVTSPLSLTSFNNKMGIKPVCVKG